MKRKMLFMVAAVALLVAACSTDKAVGPKRPTVKDQPQSFIYGQGAEAVPLTVTATTKDKKAKLTYQWYSNKINSAKGGAKVASESGKLVSGVEGGHFTPPTDTVGVFYYYVTVSSTLHKETAKKTSEVAVITVMDVAAEDMPVINAQNGDGDSDPSATVIGDDLVLTVDVEDSDDPIVSYQWYKNTRNSNVGGTLIPDATSATYIAPTDVEGTTYYYVVITTQSGKVLTSLPIKVTVVLEKPVDPDDPEDPDNPGPPPGVDARPPVILEHPQGGAVYITGDPAEPLTVSAFTNDGTLSYQWYAGGTIIDGATEAEYTPSTDTAGTVNYHVVVTNTIYDNGDGGTKTAQATSNAAVIQVRDKVHAQTPVITEHPESAEYDDRAEQEDVVPLSVTVSVTDGGTLTYQWYKKDSTEGNTNEGGTAISADNGGTGETYTPSIAVKKHMDYYYVEITNTIPDNGDGGVKTATVTSNPAYIAVDIAPLIIGGLTAQNKVYNGTTTATITGTPTGMNVGTYKVTLHVGTAEFAQADAGNDILVRYIDWYLEGDDADKFRLVLPMLTANITKAPGYVFNFVSETAPLTLAFDDVRRERVATLTPKQDLFGNPPVIESTGQIFEYAMSTTYYSSSTQQGSANLLSWTDNPVFTGLHANTTYHFYLRAKENTNYQAGPFRTASAFSGGPRVWFETNGGGSLPFQDIPQQSTGKVTIPPAMSRFNYTFDWWYSNAEMTTPWDFDNSPTDNMILYAKWVYNPDIAAVEAKDMKWISGGSFIMGSPGSETNRNTNETQHRVALSGFYMSKYLVTQDQWVEVMESNPSFFRTAISGEDDTPGKLPVEKISWYMALVFCNKLSMEEGLEPAYRINNSTDPADWGSTVPTTQNATWDAVQIVIGSNGYRLPTEAQWEYACRAGTTTKHNTGSNDGTSPDLKLYAWCRENSAVNGTRRPHQVGLKLPNNWGLYDMLGNLYEWCWDAAGSPIADYGSASQVNPQGPSSGNNRVVRGGHYNQDYMYARRSAARSSNNPHLPISRDYYGLRLVRPAN